MEIFPVDWSACDAGHEDPRFEIRCFGKDADGKDILARIQFTPFFFVKMPVNWSEARVKLFATQSTGKYGAIRTHTVKRTPLLGFTNCAQHEFLQLVFPTLEKFKRAKWNIPKYEKLATFEAALDPLLRFFHVRELSPSSWMTVSNARDIGVGADDRVSIPSVREIVVNFKDVGPSQFDRIPRLVMASFDIECVSAKGNFPNPDLPDDVIIAIGTAFQYYGETEPFKKHIVTLGTCDDIDGVEVVRCETEADVINAWIDEVVARGSDYLVGYNTFGFDFKYISGRANILVDDLTGNALVHLQKLGKSIEGCGLPVQKNLASSAYGDNSYFYLATPGMTSLDLLQIFKKELKLDSYSLANVSAKYLDNETKLDLKPGHIFEKFKLTSKDRADIAEYCIRDVELPLKLMRRLNTIENTLQMSNATCVPVDFLQFRGQQIRVFSLLTRKARQLGFVAPDTEKMDPGTEKYEGATVLDAAKGAYFEIVSALDFASLYPSIIRAHCMCPSTIVRNPAYADLEGIEYYSVETGAGTVSFAQGTKNVVPALLEELATFRKNAKKNMGRAKEAGDEFMAGVFDGQQKAYKVSMNSVYGFFGALRGILPLVEMAAAVTATGRAMIEHSKAMAETLVPGTRVIYGDTDSILCIFAVDDAKRYDLAEHFRVAQDVADKITQTFKQPIELEFEKCYWPYLLFSKKRYAGKMYTQPDHHDYIDVKGIQLVRRDNSPLVKTVSNAILAAIMHERSVEKAVKCARDLILDVLRGSRSIDEFVISKALRTGYKNPDSLPHVMVARKIQERTGAPPVSGERVNYVFIRDAMNPDGLIAMRAEDPVHVATNHLELDTLYYVENQLLSPITTLLEVLGVDVNQEIMRDPAILPILVNLRSTKKDDIQVAKRTRLNKKNNQNEITSFFKRSV